MPDHSTDSNSKIRKMDKDSKNMNTKRATYQRQNTGASTKERRNTSNSLLSNTTISPRVRQQRLDIDEQESQTFGELHGLHEGFAPQDSTSPIMNRTQSDTSLHHRIPTSPSSDFSQLKQPGGFRRHFIAQRARQQGKIVPEWITRNVTAFLGLYGHFGGGVFSSDSEEEYEDEEVEVDSVDEDVLKTVGDSSSSPSKSPSDEENIDIIDDNDNNDTTPLLSRPQSPQTVGTTSNSKTFFLLLKAFIGTGVLFLPKAFSNGGLVFSLVLMVAIGYLTVHCMLLLTQCAARIGGSYGEIGEKLFGPRMREIVVWSIAISQMGFCCAYMIFVAQNIRSVVATITSCSVILPTYSTILLQLLLYIPLSWVRKIKHFSITSLIADVFILLGLIYILGWDITVLHKRGVSPGLVMMNYDKFPLFIGTAIFAYEGIGLILPISQTMKHPHHFPWLLSVTLLLLGVVMIAVGGIGYITFGPNLETITFLDLEPTACTMVIQCLYVAAIAFSFPLTVYPAIRVTETYLFPHRTGKHDAKVKWIKNMYRALLVLSLAGISIVGSSSLDKFVSIIGSFACIPLSFIYPSLFHAKLFGHTKWVWWKDVAIAIFGGVALVYTTVITLMQWAHQEQPDEVCRAP